MPRRWRLSATHTVIAPRLAKICTGPKACLNFYIALDSACWASFQGIGRRISRSTRAKAPGAILVLVNQCVNLPSGMPVSLSVSVFVCLPLCVCLSPFISFSLFLYLGPARAPEREREREREREGREQAKPRPAEKLWLPWASAGTTQKTFCFHRF